MVSESAIEFAVKALKPLLNDIGKFPELRRIIDAKDEVLSRYRPVFRRESLEHLTPADFASFVRFENNHHWTGLARKTAHVCNDLPRFKDTLSALLDESKPIAGRVDFLLPKWKPIIKGLGKALATAILHIAYPDKYGVWNNTSEKGMKIVGVWPEPGHGATAGECYQQMNIVLNRLTKELKIDLWTLDSLWWRAKFLNIPLIPEEILTPEKFTEGAPYTIIVNAYERNPDARKRCLELYGYKCTACKRSMADMYGKDAEGIIHVHHLKGLSTIGE